jgi:putative transposase
MLVMGEKDALGGGGDSLSKPDLSPEWQALIRTLWEPDGKSLVGFLPEIVALVKATKSAAMAERGLLERDDFGLNRGGFPNQRCSDSACWLGRRPVWMGKPYSMDLRERAVGAVLKEGLSRHESAARFGVAPSTVINWARRFRETGSVAPGQMGGRKPKAIAGEYAAFLARRVRDGAFTLRGLVAELAERGLKVDYRSVWNFVHAEKLSFKKNRRRQRTRSA